MDEIKVGSDILYNNAVDSLVSAMASFGNPAAGDMVIPEATKNDLTSSLAAAWQSSRRSIS